MFAIVATSLFIVVFIGLLHYSQHFKWKFRPMRRGTGYGCQCCCSSLADDTNGSFVAVFLFYVAFIASLSILVIANMYLNYYYFDPNDKKLAQLLSEYSLFNQHQIKAYYLSDFILIYALMLLSLLESYISFCRCILVTTMSKNMIISFILFAIIFCATFIIQIHFYYWIFPFIIILFLSFNYYFIHKPVAMITNTLTQQYKSIIGYDVIIFRDISTHISRTKNIAVMCSVLQSIHLFVFLIIYNINVIYYLPILWCICTFLFMLQFPNNRSFLQSHCRIFILCKCCTTECFKMKSHCCSCFRKRKPFIPVATYITETEHDDFIVTLQTVHNRPKFIRNQMYVSDHDYPIQTTFLTDHDFIVGNNMPGESI
eukprot:356286_1